VYMIGLLRLQQYIPVLATLLESDSDVLLEEVTQALISFQSDEVVKEVAPYAKKYDSLIFATSVLENTKTDLAVKALLDAYAVTDNVDDHELIIEALCHHFTKEALPAVETHMKMEYTAGMVDIEQVVYS